MSYTESKKILILGVNGYLGRGLANYLRGLGQRVVGVGRQEKCALNVDRYIKINVLDKLFPSIVSEVKPDVIVDFVSFVRPDDKNKWAGFMQEAVTSYRRLVDDCFSEYKYIFISSGGTVYGNSQVLLTESDSVDPLSSYAEQKVRQEACVVNRSFEKKKYILRLCNPYGGDQVVKYGVGFVSHVINSALKGVPVNLFVPGETSRDYIYIHDVLNYIYLFIINDYEEGIYNVSTGVATKLIDLINMIYSRLDLIPNINCDHEFAVSGESYINKNVLNNKKITAQTGFSPRYTIDTGLSEIIKGELI